MKAHQGTVSIVIATYNRASLLTECLQALAVQAFEPDDEVIIADNASTDDTRTVVESAARWFPVSLRYVCEPRAGKSQALAAGLTQAAGDILAFTDDDVLVTRDWLQHLRSTMSDPSIALAAGRVEPRWESEPPRWLRFRGSHGYTPLSSPLALLDYGPYRSSLGARTALGANMVVRRSALNAIGGFPTTLGKLRDTLLSGEDRYVCEHLRDAGHTCVYDPHIVVRHWVPRDRLRLTYYLRWFFWSGITNSVLDQARQPSERQLLNVPRYLLRQLPVDVVGAIADVARGRTSLALEHVFNAAFTLGYIAHRWRVSPSGLPVARQARAQHT